MAETYTVTRRRIPWTPASAESPLPLGRHVHHDSRSLAYAHRYEPARVLSEVVHSRHIPILDQGSKGDCTTNAGTGAAGSDSLFAALPAGHPALDEPFAVSMYRDEEQLLFGDPDADEGGDGLTTCKIMAKRGLISGYTHCLSLDAFLDALMDGPVLLGCNWYSSMDSPLPTGEVVISPGAYVRGGHEIVARGLDPLARTVLLDNSWGPGWGIGGSFILGWGTLERLLAEQGDGTVPLPLSAPAPVPVPPVPPSPGPLPPADWADSALAAVAEPWISHRHEGGNARMASALRTWLAAKGF